MNSQARWIKSKADASLNPEQVANALDVIAAQWPGSLEKFLRGFPIGVDALVHLLAISTICAERLQRDPELLHWLAQPEVCASDRGPRRMLAQLQASTTCVTADNFLELRRWKAREMTRIALREVAGVAALEQTMAELSCLAEVCLSTVYQHADAVVRARYGAPGAEFTALGLGKLGGRELNHSSDIDLIFLYGEEGELAPRLTNHDWHNRLAEGILKAFSAREPSLWRIDLRLRPEGAAGPLTRSLESMENYYAGFGETWERFALMKARRVCGSEELAYEFLRQHQPFIFPKSPTPELIAEIAAIKRRIEREVPLDEFNVKLGAGGIREIEFVVQTLQFMHGAHHPFLQETSTLKALSAVAQLELLPIAQVQALDHAYRFLRRVEHRLQIEEERQTHSIPDDLLKRERLARSLDFASADELLAELRSANSRVREIFDNLIASGTAASTVDLGFFIDQARATRSLNELARGSSSFHVAPRTRQVFGRLRPLLLEQLARCADPDVTLTAVLRFVEAFGLRSLLFELLTANPKLLELLVQTFDASAFATNALIRRPQWLEELTRSADLGHAFSVEEHRAALFSFIAQRDLDGIRTYRQTQLLRTTIRDVIGLAPQLFAELSGLAEGCLLATIDLIGAHNLTVVAMGKFGGHELTYGSDLDLMFVGNDYRAAQNLINALAASTAEGAIASVDVRLRPEGEKGPLVGSLETFGSYYRGRAQLWEIQALTRARPIAGPEQNRFCEIAHAAWSRAAREDDLLFKIGEMLERIRKDRGSGNDALDFKTGRGGIIEAEFLVQALQMRHDVRETSTLRAIDKLLIPDAEALRRPYAFLRRIETVLRRWLHTASSTLPADLIEREKLARRMRFDGNLDAACADARAEIHTIFERHFGCNVQ
jgi:[glutamine synthetase] adenylyltransferase / [glutamine synthetase]-adenylyl-L-tyrosine phosphorylase